MHPGGRGGQTAVCLEIAIPARNRTLSTQERTACGIDNGLLGSVSLLAQEGRNVIGFHAILFQGTHGFRR
jgi:hypothetical protein